jgi:fluoroquinolone resistance protein
MEEQLVKSKNYSKQSLEEQVFSECTFQGCDFSEAILRNARFSSCRFVNCNLSLVKLDGCRFHDVEWIDCKIVGAEFFKCEKTFFSVTFKNCLLHYCNFSDMNLKGITFCGSKVKECYFTSTHLSGADFTDVDLSGSIFHNCDLSKADFSTAIQYSIDPQNNKVKKAKFSLPEAISLLHGFEITIV